MSDIKVSAARSSERAAGFVLIVNGLAQRVGREERADAGRTAIEPP